MRFKFFLPSLKEIVYPRDFPPESPWVFAKDFISSDEGFFLTFFQCDARLYTEIADLKQALAENHSQLMAMETACLQESDRHVELEDSLIAWQDKYDRLHESHKRVQKINQCLEDKLLKLVDRNSGERAQLTSDVATLSVRLAQANYNIASLQREIVSDRSSLN